MTSMSASDALTSASINCCNAIGKTREINFLVNSFFKQFPLSAGPLFGQALFNEIEALYNITILLN